MCEGIKKIVVNALNDILNVIIHIDDESDMESLTKTYLNTSFKLNLDQISSPQILLKSVLADRNKIKKYIFYKVHSLQRFEYYRYHRED